MSKIHGPETGLSRNYEIYTIYKIYKTAYTSCVISINDNV